jgi:hypothetical protein
MDRPLPQPGDTYRHYKGKLAHVLGVATSAEPGEFALCNSFATARRSDGAPYPIEIRRDDEEGGLRFRASLSFGEGPLVIYSCSGDIWARPLDEFMEVLGNTRNERGGTMYHRFQKLPDNFWDTPAPKKDLGSIGDLLAANPNQLTLPSGVTIWWEETGQGRAYYTDSCGGGAEFWHTAISSEEELLFAMRVEAALRAEEGRKG